MKPGYKTTEFWLTIFANVAPVLQGSVDPKISAAVGAVTAGFYAFSRGMAKAKQNEKF